MNINLSENKFDLEEYHYDLPEELIAQSPSKERENSRLLAVNLNKPMYTDTYFSNISEHLPKKALIIANNSKVVPARIFGSRENGTKVEMLIITPIPLLENSAKIIDYPKYSKTNLATVLIKASRKIKVHEKLYFPDFTVEILEKQEYGQHIVNLYWENSLLDTLEQHGLIPLPPYIKRSDGIENDELKNNDKTRYQTIYAQNKGSVAAPTAGLHFTKEIQESLINKGFLWEEITLHVGYGTFSPVRANDIRQHQMHAEYVEIPEKTAKAILKAKSEQVPIIAIGTTVTRALEGMALAYEKYLNNQSDLEFILNKNESNNENLQKNQDLLPICGCQGYTNIFMYPGKKFNVISGLITNFHLPKSSLLMLVSAFAGHERIMKIYNHAIAEKYRFFSYGDAMLLS